MSIDRINKLTSLFSSLIKTAEEVDSTSVTLAVRPVVNKLLSRVLPASLSRLNKYVEGSKIILGGVLTISASKVSGKWKVSSLSFPGKILGTSSENQEAIQALDNEKVAVANILTPAIEKEFDRLDKNWVGADTISNVEVEVGTMFIPPGK